jgi:uncharacterized membrane protein YfcA
MMSPWFLAGLAAASVLYSSVGHAGASGYLAVMALAGVDAAVMKPAALVLNLAVAAIATARFARAGHFSWPLLWPFAVTSVPLAFVGGAIQLPGQWYKQAVGLVLIFAASRLFLDTRQQNDTTRHGRPPLAAAMISGAAIGLLAGLTGTGGGIFLSPLLLFTGWSGTRESGGVSAAFILLNSASGLAGNVASLGALPSNVWLWSGIVVVGGLIGSELGSRRVAVTTFRRLLAAVLFVAGMKLLLLL